MENNPDEFSTDPTQYRIESRVGRGASSSVYKAFCLSNNQYCALKVVDLESLQNSVAQMHQEILAMQILKTNPFLCTYSVSFTKSSFLFIVMPLMRCSCYDILHYGFPNGLEEPHIATILHGVLQGLIFLHNNDQIHRDIKSGNILISEQGQVKLADFGVVAQQIVAGRRLSGRNTFVGTVNYMSPELISQKSYHTAADIWSLGITAIELAHGKVPLSDMEQMKALMHITQSEPPQLNSVGANARPTRAFKDFIAMCLQRDPSQRATAQQLLNSKFIKNMTRKPIALVEEVLSVFNSRAPTYDTNISRELSSLFKGLTRGESLKEEWNFEDLDDEPVVPVQPVEKTPEKEPAKPATVGRFQVAEIDEPQQPVTAVKSETPSEVGRFQVSDVVDETVKSVILESFSPPNHTTTSQSRSRSQSVNVSNLNAKTPVSVVDKNDDPNWLLRELGNSIANMQSEITNLRQENIELRSFEVQYNSMRKENRKLRIEKADLENNIADLQMKISLLSVANNKQ
ncbi:hypothetical protein PCE1_000196 [Barthelona sp. PCE]